MSSTVIEPNTPRCPPSSSNRVEAMDEEKISINSLKFSLESRGDFQIGKDMTVACSSKNVEGQKESLHSVATALTDLVKPAKTDDSQQDDEKSEDFEIPLRFTKSGRKRAVPFPLKLMKVLSQAEFADIITWLPDGKSFTILKPKAFVSEILSKESGLGFKQAKYSSFTRKLHRWGFMRHYRGDEAGAFYHKLFVKDRLDLVEKMTCNKVEPPRQYASASSDQKHTAATTQGKPKPTAAALAKAIPKPLNAPLQSLPRAGMEQIRRPAPPPNASNMPIRQQRHSLPMPSAPTLPNNLSTSERLNAAIEMEVARRLKERITAAALSRHALAMMQQQIMPQPAAASLPILRDSSGLTWNSAAAASALHRRAAAAAAGGNPLQMSSLNLNPIMLAKGRPMLHHPGAGMVGLRIPNNMVGGIPMNRDMVTTFQSNIEGAKTA